MKWQEIPVEEIGQHKVILPATLHYNEDKSVFLIPVDESPQPSKPVSCDAMGHYGANPTSSICPKCNQPFNYSQVGKEAIEIANSYAERVCNGIFPITYTREQVVKHTAGDYLAGMEYFQKYVLGILYENMNAAKRGLAPEDKIRPAEESIIETYEDLIAIITNYSGTKWAEQGKQEAPGDENEVVEEIKRWLSGWAGEDAYKLFKYVSQHYTLTKKQL